MVETGVQSETEASVETKVLSESNSILDWIDGEQVGGKQVLHIVGHRTK